MVLQRKEKLKKERGKKVPKSKKRLFRKKEKMSCETAEAT
jgi:hypothetical protein